MSKSNYVGKHAMYLERRAQLRGFVETYTVEREGRCQRAAMLVECGVDDPNRFGYFNGSWYKLEQVAETERQLKRIEFEDMHGIHDLVECDAEDENMLLKIDGIAYKLG